MENNNNELNETEQPAPVIEKVSLKNIETERNDIELEADDPINNLIKAALELDEEDLKKAIAFIDKKLGILKNKK